MVSPRLDVAVVGAGVVGLAIAREVAGRGARVAVFERAGIGAGASGVQPGGVRQQWGTPIACRMARESAAFYADADERLDAGAARLPRVRLPVRRARGGDVAAAGRERRRAARAKGSRRGSCRRARPPSSSPGSSRDRRRRRLVRRGRVLRPAAGRRRGVRTRARRADRRGARVVELEARTASSSPPAPTRRRSCPATADRARGPLALLLRADRRAAARSARRLAGAPLRREAARRRARARERPRRARRRRAARAWRANVRAGIEELLPRADVRLVPPARPWRVRRDARPPAAARSRSRRASTLPRASAATGS